MKSPISKLLILLSCECNQNQQKTHLLSKLPFLGNRNLYRLALELQSVKHSLHQAGHYYCLDFSSIFSASTLLTISQSIKLILDMCTAPEGKSIFAWKTLKPELLLCNEVIGKRIGMPISNLKPCQIKPSVATNVDSKILTEKIPPTAILVIVDAPYTGQLLLIKGDKAPGCFHHVTINSNAKRKKLANSAKIVARPGYLAYMNCTYSTAENEQVNEWLLSKFPEFEPVTVPPLETFRSHLTEIPCYRMWPQDKLGAGSFTVLFQNTSDGERNQLPADFRDLAHFTNL